jgi:hypothetical protein
MSIIAISINDAQCQTPVRLQVVLLIGGAIYRHAASGADPHGGQASRARGGILAVAQALDATHRRHVATK